MTMRMLIDARHREETRVAVVKGNRIEEFDFESAEKKQLKGNIYLAKVTRVEPSLQAAFVDYGGNRHGFLAFSEIHPDYYQIPKEDRDALLREEAEHAAEEAAIRDQEVDDGDADAPGDGNEPHDDDGGERPARGNNGSDDAVEALRQRRMNLRRRYKIQDVIRRRQVLLVQVVKEERGNKGAALTTYLSLAGRYCVLMPNTSHGGGISRKISNAADRKRLKSIMADLKLPPSMGCIVRTAGLQRTKTEIKRDFDYLARLWDEIRDKTLASSAPALVYGDSDLIKRAIRDIYNRDIDEVIVEGEEGYRHAKDFMKLLMPSHARRVKHYSDPVPLFQRHHVEDQLAAMYHPVVQLKSGGYLVINPTEALVSIDINSGRATREHNIEQTATQTNLEAAQEIARQLRLRDMAGLVVIDFIDMDNSSNVRKVEKAMKEALKNDRARIQVGRISSFGLLEMSRQRLRTGVLEASTRQCPHCEGTGLVRTASSAGLSALRLLEDEAARGRGSLLTLRASQEACFYLLNRKRRELAEIEARYGVAIEVAPDGEREGARMTVEASGPPPAHAPLFAPPMIEPDDEIDEPELDEIEEEEEEEVEERAEAPSEERGDANRRKRRRRRGRRGRIREDDASATNAGERDGDEESDTAGAGEERVDAPADAPTGDEPARRKRRRNRRRRGDRGDAALPVMADSSDAIDAEDAPVIDDEADADVIADAGDVGPLPPVAAEGGQPEALAEQAAKPKRTRRKKAEATAEPLPEPPTEAVVEPAEAEEAPKPKRTRRKKAEADAAPVAAAEPVAEAPLAEEPAADAAPDGAPKPRRPRRKKAEAVVEAAPDTAPAASNPQPEAPPLVEPVGLDAAPAPALAASATDETAAAEAEPAPTASNDDNGEAPAEAAPPAAPRRGWWQRTFGA